VHGGAECSAPLLVDAALLARLEALVPLAPLHQPQALAGIRIVRARRPGVAQVACFDTAFHRGRPSVAERFGLPDAWYRRGIRRYGFHGLSYEYVTAKLRELAPQRAAGRVVIAHLGNGASLCAVRAGRSLDTTMSFSALDGVPMGTRCGSLDPGVVLYLLREGGMDLDAVESLLYEQSGLLGISGLTSDMRELVASRALLAREAIDYFVHRIVREIGALAAVLGGLDALVFTAGIGENAPAIRERICRGVAWLGLRLDEEANRSPSGRISVPGATPEAWVIPTDEERMIALHTAAALPETRG
jgi:acetate kinase